ncbi:hypothetical protein [Algibacter lectus]|uniref:Uncharacterized protein n=1 Tax=Algibacter lectus TaxID=221126 RepID=A0A4R8MEI4_9FLAO|nr:hypothetical protein [Algibacter lectus]MWW25307.1 hypothetical protein [Algibacter lectus]TDY64280.1 hypothetical protein DFQ06_1187 [Algibacter lectus]
MEYINEVATFLMMHAVLFTGIYSKKSPQQNFRRMINRVSGIQLKK